MSGFVRAVGTAVAVVGSIALAAGTFGVGGIAAAGLLSSIGTYASAGAALLSVGAALTAKKPSNERQGQQLQFKIDPNGPVPYVMGRTAVGGTVVYRDTYGKDNSYQTFFTVLSGGGPVDAIEAFTADRAVIPFAGTNATGYYAKWLWQDQQLGQTPEPDALTNGITVAPYGYAGTPPGWGPGSKLSGYAAASLSLLFDTKARRYANGEPTPGWIVRGARVYDPRRDSTFPGGSGPCRWADPSDTAAHAAARATWVYSDRPALHGLMWRLGIWQRDETDPDARYQKIMGIGAPIDMIDLDAIAHAANVQDANGWAIGGQVDSQMDKWEVLKLIEQTGGCEAIANGALMSTLVKAPRVPLRTITAADLADGKLSAPGMRARSDRINGYRAKFRSEPHGWEMTPIDIVQVPDYVAADGRAKTGSGDFSLCPDPDQCAELAAYEVFDSRELSPIVLPLKPFAMGYRLGDCLTIDIPELGIVKVDAIVRAANRDPGTAICTLTFQTETAAKHPAALGLTGDTPPTPTLTAAPDVINPPAGGAWALVATVSVSSGLTVPALAIIGQVDNSNADAILFEYRKVDTTDWINGGLSAPDTVRREFTAVEADTPYEARVSYRGRGIYSEPLLLAAVDSSGAYADWAAGVQGPGKPANNATNSGDPKSAFGANGTVGDALANVRGNAFSTARGLAEAEVARLRTQALNFMGPAGETAFTLHTREETARKSADEVFAETFDLLGAVSEDRSAFVLDAETVRIAGDVTLAQRFQSISVRAGKSEASVEDVRQVLIGPDGAEARALLTISVGQDGKKRVGGMALTGTNSEIGLAFAVDAFRLEDPDTGVPYFYVDKTGVVRAPRVFVDSLVDGSVNTASMTSGASQKAAFYILPGDVAVPKSSTVTICSMSFTKEDADSILEIQMLLKCQSDDDIQFDGTIQVDGMVMDTTPVNVVLVKNNAQMPITPFTYVAGIAAGARTVSFKVYNRETDADDLTIRAGSTLKVVELRKPSIGTSTGSGGSLPVDNGGGVGSGGSPQGKGNQYGQEIDA